MVAKHMMSFLLNAYKEQCKNETLSGQWKWQFHLYTALEVVERRFVSHLGQSLKQSIRYAVKDYKSIFNKTEDTLLKYRNDQLGSEQMHLGASSSVIVWQCFVWHGYMFIYLCI